MQFHFHAPRNVAHYEAKAKNASEAHKITSDEISI